MGNGMHMLHILMQYSLEIVMKPLILANFVQRVLIPRSLELTQIICLQTYLQYQDIMKERHQVQVDLTLLTVVMNLVWILFVLVEV